MKREIYLWIILVAVVLVAALYYRYYYSSAISLKVGVERYGGLQAQVIYPEQELFFNITVNNTGSTAIDQMGVDLLVNGNITYVYDVTVPAGKVGHAEANYTPPAGGDYNITVVADPGKVYNIPDRSTARASVMVPVTALQNPVAYVSLPSNNATVVYTENLDSLGFIWYSALSSEYGLNRFNLTGLPGLAQFGTALDYIGSYTENISAAHAVYKNGSVVYSIWMNPGEYRDILPVNIVGVAAEGLNMSVTNRTEDGRNVTFVGLADNDSLCSWNSGGWIKMIASSGNESCLGLVGDNSTGLEPKAIAGVKLVPPLISGFVVANDTLASGNVESESYSAVFSNTIDFASVTVNAGTNDTCEGQISSVDNATYCSSFVFPINGSESAPYLIRTRAEIGAYNITALWRTNESDIPGLIPEAIAVLQGYNAIGTSAAFVNGIPPQCTIPGFGCENATFTNGTVSMRILNYNTTSVTLDSLGCVFLGATYPVKLNITLPGLGIGEVNTTCYDEGQVATSLPTGLAFTLRLNYTSANIVHSVNGSIYVAG